MPRNFLSFIVFCSVIFTTAQAQQDKIFADNIRTFRIDGNNISEALPCIRLNSRDVLRFSFDELTHEYHRFTYSVQHCDKEWQLSDELFESDYLTSAGNEVVIEDYQPSLNTSVLYTHYSFSFPNPEIRPLLSGNYLLTIFRDDDEGNSHPVIESHFCVLDAQVSLQVQATTNTDVDWNDSHQQLSVSLDMGSLQVRDSKEDVQLVVVQNNRWDIAVINPVPTAVTNNKLLWQHSRDLLFKAGNEYRKFEVISTHYPGMHMEGITWFEPYYHATLFADEPRRNYLYDEDQNGISVIRCEDSAEPQTESDYVYVHYRLLSDYIPNHNIYINGAWNQGQFLPEYCMRYNSENRTYEADVLQKMGYYNYQYLAVPDRLPKIGLTAPIEGDFFQTENRYTIFVYYRKPGARYDQLVGYTTFSYRPE